MDIPALVLGAIVVLAFIYLSPKKIPEVAKALGSAKREFEKALRNDNKSEEP